MERINLGDVTLAVEVRGDGPVVLLVHGFPLDHQMWRRQIDELAATCRVIAPDLRGFGQSDVTPGVVTMARFADDLAALLDKLAVTGPITYCGLSMGGYVGWQFLKRHAARVGKLIICDSKAAADSLEAAQGRLATAQKVLAEGAQVVVDAMLPKFFAQRTFDSDPDLVRSTVEIMRATSAEAIAAALRGMAEREDFSQALASINLPTLVICGEEDNISSPDEMRTIAAALRGSQFLSVPAASHMAPLENPGAVNPAILRFIHS